MSVVGGSGGSTGGGGKTCTKKPAPKRKSYSQVAQRQHLP